MTRARFRWVLAVVAVSAFMITLDNTVINVALSTIQRDLHMSAVAVAWVGTGYILMFSCLMIAGGRLADIHGTRNVFVIGLAVFTAASAVAGLAHDDVVLIMARVVQGAGAALAMPSIMVMVAVGRSDRERTIGTIVWVGTAAVATAFGPTIGGLIVSRWDWGWIFLINIVPGVLVMVFAMIVLPAGNPAGGGPRATRVDLPGVLTSATMLFAFTYAMELARDPLVGWDDPALLSVVVLAVVALLAFMVVESWAPEPLIDLDFLRNRVFAGGLVSQMMWGIGFNGMLFYAPFFLQNYLGFTPTKSGLVLLPPALTIMAITPVSFWVAGKIGARITIGGGMALMAVGMFVFSMLRQGAGYPSLMPGVIILAIGSALCMPLAMYVLQAIREEQAGVAGGIINTIRELSGAFGIVVLGALVHDIPGRNASAAELETFRHGTSMGLVLGGAVVLAGGLIAAATLPRKKAAATEPEPAVASDKTATPERLGNGTHRPSTGPERQPAGIWTESARATVGLWPPPPPDGWYRPYVPEEDDIRTPQLEEAGPLRYRSNAW